MLASARSGLEAAHAPFRTGLLEAVQRLRQQRGAVVLAALAGGDAGVHRETDDVAVWHRGIGMLFERRPEPLRLDQLATHDQGIEAFGDEGPQRRQRLLEIFAGAIESNNDRAERRGAFLLGNWNADDAASLDRVVSQVAGPRALRNVRDGHRPISVLDPLPQAP